jgi:hypothetical protein
MRALDPVSVVLSSWPGSASMVDVILRNKGLHSYRFTLPELKENFVPLLTPITVVRHPGNR